jgi:hypothetical protein
LHFAFASPQKIAVVTRMMVGDMRRGSVVLLFVLLVCCLCFPGCSTSSGFKVNSIAKTDIDEIADIHLRQVTRLLKVLTGKLYKKNPCELKKTPNATISKRIATIFRCPATVRYGEVNYLSGTDAMLLAFDPEFEGDRVFAVMYGLYTMILRSYDNRCEMFILDYLNQQSLYNSARNIEILVWRLKERRRPDGKPFLLTNSLDGEIKNLSFERLFGKLISLQDTMALIVSKRTRRVIKKVIQFVGMAFLPVGF